MTHMLEALKQIQAKSPQTRQGIKPVSSEELESFGLRETAGLRTQEPPQARKPVQASEPEKSDEPANTEGHETTAQPGQAVEPAQAAVSIEPVESVQGAEPSPPIVQVPEHVLPDGGDEPVGGAAVSEKAPEASEPAEPDRGIVRLLSPLAEEHRKQYGELADNILAHLSPVRPAVLMFTSAGDGEGKTETLASLATVLAEKVTDEIVAVDANLRRPALANRFGIWVNRGLVDVLTRGVEYRDVVRKTSIQRLSVLPGGRLPADDGSWPEESKLVRVLDALRLRYRLVLVDAASLLYPEVAPLSRLCEGTYLVAELGRTARGAARQAVRLIEDCGGRVLGCVLTGVPVEMC